MFINGGSLFIAELDGFLKKKPCQRNLIKSIDNNRALKHKYELAWA